MKQKKPNSKLQAILFERGIKIVDLYNKIEEENDKPVAKYMISQIVNGKRTNYEIITLNKICKALGVSPNEIIEENPTRFSASQKSIKSNTKKTKEKPVLSPKTEEPSVEHDGMRYNPEKASETLEFTDEQLHIARKDEDYAPSQEEIIKFNREENTEEEISKDMCENIEKMEEDIEIAEKQKEEDDDFGF